MFLLENPTKMDDLGVPPFLGNLHNMVTSLYGGASVHSILPNHFNICQLNHQILSKLHWIATFLDGPTSCWKLWFLHSKMGSEFSIHVAFSTCFVVDQAVESSSSRHQRRPNDFFIGSWRANPSLPLLPPPNQYITVESFWRIPQLIPSENRQIVNGDSVQHCHTHIVIFHWTYTYIHI